jgi:hypothetical protein
VRRGALLLALALTACGAARPAPTPSDAEVPMVELIRTLVTQLANATSARDLAAALGHATPAGDTAFTVRSNELRLGTLRVVADAAGTPLQIEVTLPSRSGLTVNELKRAFGSWKETPKVSWTSPPNLAFPWVDLKDAPATVALFARLSLGSPVSDAAMVEGLLVRRDAR